MRGEQSVINQKVLKHLNNPIKDSIGGKTPEEIIRVIEKEYWDEWVRKLNFSTTGVVYCHNLGKFYLGFSQLKGYIRTLIKNIRSKRESIITYDKEGRHSSKQLVMDQEADLVLKLRCAWKQLDEQRMLFILRTIRWNKKLVEKRESERIKIHYDRIDFKFINKE